MQFSTYEAAAAAQRAHPKQSGVGGCSLARLVPEFPARVLERLYQRIDDALIWTGTVINSGYGKINWSVRGLQHQGCVHQMIWRLEHNMEPLLPGQQVHHTNFTRLSCDPTALVRLTTKEHGRLHLLLDSIAARATLKTRNMRGMHESELTDADEVLLAHHEHQIKRIDGRLSLTVVPEDH